ncbi:MAG: response regulator transcription factor [Pseudomonadota bacterium]|nr:response regulator transcription factor [Pseudomonadota bacterium]
MLAHSEVGRGDFGDADTRALLISDVSPADPLRINLEHSALDLHFCSPGAQAVAAAVQERPQLLLVDCREDEGAGLQLCSALRSIDELALAFVIVITRDDREELRIKAFQAGADDCFAEPKTGRELGSRLEAAKRRIRKDVSSEILKYADVELDLRRHKVRRAGTSIGLSSLQMRLLKYLMENPAVVFTRQELLEAVWGDKKLDDGAVTVGVVRLRRALNSTGLPNLIRQVRGIGYALDADLDD